MSAPRVYIKTHSIKLTGSAGTLQWCASYVSSSATCAYRWFKVDSFDTSYAPQAGSNPVTTGTSSTLSALTVPWNGEEAGYGWDANLQSTTIPSTTPNGLYVLQVSGDSWSTTNNSYFVVRVPTTSTTAMLCYPFSTLVAYAGGAAGQHLNLYDSYQPARLRRVSLDRPWDAWPFSSTKVPVCLNYPLLLEKRMRSRLGDSKVDVCTSFDLDTDSALLTNFILFVSAGHDEYWSKAMRDAVKSFVAAGNNAAFFSANTAWWEVRFESSGRQMVCYKSTVEDPKSGTDNPNVTGNTCSVPSAGISGGGANQEENTLTGVSYRRGTAGEASSTPYSVITSGHPYLSGVSGSTFGAGLFVDETDAVDRNGNFVTGADGTPSTFEIIANADMRTMSSLGQRGQATMGRFTNVGTVFTGGTISWANKLGDADVSTITNNVLEDLKETRSRAAWTLATRSYPGSSWTEVVSLTGTVPAVVGVVLGQLVTNRDGTVYYRDPENPSTSSDTSSSIPNLTNLTAFGSDLWGTFVFACTSDGKLHRRDGSVLVTESWDTTSGYPVTPPDAGAGVGVAGHDKKAFVVLRPSAGTTALYRQADGLTTHSLFRLGRMYPPIRPIASMDGLLFGVRDAGSDTTSALDLYCRSAVPVDLTWTKIGTAPAATYALAAYYGRLYALAGATTTNPKLHWRAAIADTSFPYRPPSLLLLNGTTYALGTLASNGDFATQYSGTLSSGGYSLVTRTNGTMVFFYSSDGSAVLRRFNADGSVTTVKSWGAGSFGAWDIIAYVRVGNRSWTDLSDVGEQVFFYNASSGNVVIGTFNTSTGSFSQTSSGSGFALGWTHLRCTHKGEIIFYKASTGACAVGYIDASGVYTNLGTGTVVPTTGSGGFDQVVPVGNTYLAFYKSGIASGSPNGALYELLNGSLGSGPAYNCDFSEDGGSGSRDGLLLTGSTNGVVFVYRSASGAAVVTGFHSSNALALRAYAAGVFGNWSTIVPLGIIT